MLDTPTIPNGGTITVNPREGLPWTKVWAAMTPPTRAPLSFGPYPLREVRLEVRNAQ